MKKLFTFILAAVFATMAWATTITIADLSGLPSNADFSLKTGTFTLAGAKAEGATNPTYNANGKDLRLYAKNTLTVSTTGDAMTKIVFKLSTAGLKRLAPITTSTGAIATQAAGDATVTWTGSAKSITFTVGEKAEFGSDGATKAGQFDFTEIEINGGDGGSEPDPDPDPVTGDMTIAKFNTLDDNTEVTFDGTVTVLGQKDKYLYVKDATGFMLVYGSVGQTYKKGDVIPAGFGGVKTTYDMEPELKSPTGFAASTETETVNAETITISGVTHDNWGKYVLIKGVTVDADAKTISDATGSIGYYDRFGITFPTDGEAHDMYAIVGSYKTNYQLLPVEFAGSGSVEPQPGDYTDYTIGDLIKLTANKAKVNLILEDAVVLMGDENGNQIYVRESIDSENAIQFYKLGLGALESGTVLNGSIKVDYEVYKEFPEVKANDDTNANDIETSELTEDDEFYATEATIAELNDGLHKNDVVSVDEVTLKLEGKNFFIYDEEGNKAQLYDKYGYDLLPDELDEDGVVVSVMGVFGQYYNNVPELYLLDIDGLDAGGDYLSDVLYYSEDGDEVTIAEDLYVMYINEVGREVLVTDNYFDEWDLSEYGAGVYYFYPSWALLDFSDNEEGFEAVADAQGIAGGTMTGIINEVATNPVIAITSIPEPIAMEEPEQWYIFAYDLTDEYGIIGAYGNELGYVTGYYVDGSLYGTADGTDYPVSIDNKYIGNDFTWKNGTLYTFPAIIQIKEAWEEDESDYDDYAPAKNDIRKARTARKAHTDAARKARAERREAIKKIGYEDADAATNYIVCPTAEPEIDAVEDINVDKDVKSVKFFNTLGVQSNNEFSGINIKVITYTDGTRRAVKVVK